jgi:beta-1,4-mannosyl-glycoprotein beta-1,4-N-acetylglucosaminyltransferase
MIIDCITFGGEADMLEGRLNYLYNHIDKMLIIESDRTYTGIKKDYIFENNIDRYDQYLDKVIYVKIESLNSSDPWDNDFHQRRQIGIELEKMNLSNTDVITICDTDEWWNPKSLLVMKRHLVGFEMKKFLYSLHWYQKQELTGIAGPYSFFRGKDVDKMRWQRHTYRIEKNGFHWTSMGDADYVIKKINSFAHQELKIQDWEDRVRHCWKNGIDFLTDIPMDEVEHTEEYPEWIRFKKAPPTWYHKR